MEDEVLDHEHCCELTTELWIYRILFKMKMQKIMLLFNCYMKFDSY